uniref:Phospholipid scramblase n=1 Tax=Noccaea caerulescens TaxID=107243 RepID=A0A1J3JQM9_NOCCA
MLCLSKRSVSSLLRSGSHLRGDAAAAVSCSSPFSDPDGGVKALHCLAGNAILWRNCPLEREQVSFQAFRCFSHGNGDTFPGLDRDFMAQLWVSDIKKLKAMEKRRRHRKASSKHRNDLESSLAQSDENLYKSTSQQQPPVSQSMSGLLKPTTSDEAKIANLLARSNLLVTRDIEWANLVLGFEQENRYAVVDVCYPQAPVGSIREQSNVLARQLLRTRRPFVASITDASGNELFRVRRPFWWITSSIYAEIDGEEIGVVHRRWHLWRRIYDLYLGNKQFAVVENPGFWNWTFTVKGADGEVLAQIDRDWRGFGFEILTDAGQYVIRFGKSDAASKSGPATMVEELEVTRPLTLSERAVALSLAISLDNDYFSRHGGWGIPFMAVGE